VHRHVIARGLHPGALRWIVAAAAALAFMTTLSIQTVRGGSVPPGLPAADASELIGDAIPAAAPQTSVLLHPVSIPALRQRPHRRHRGRAAVRRPAASRVVRPVAPPVASPTPHPAPARVPMVAAPPPPPPILPASPSPKPNPSAPPPRGPSFDLSG
jgi:hypothetical protein